MCKWWTHRDNGEADRPILVFSIRFRNVISVSLDRHTLHCLCCPNNFYWLDELVVGDVTPTEFHSLGVVHTQFFRPALCWSSLHVRPEGGTFRFVRDILTDLQLEATDQVLR